jgi:hypothetical protein
MNAKQFFRLILSPVVILFCSIGLQAQPNDRQRLVSLERRRFDAMIHKDTTLLSGLLADSLVYIHSSGVIDNKKSLMKDIGSGHITYLFIYPEKLTCTVEGNYGWIYGRANIRFKLASMTTTIDQYVSFVEVYRLMRYQWQLVVCQNARIEKDAPYINNFVPQVKSGEVPSIY